MWPNFREIYARFRTPEEERRLSNEALIKFGGFILAIGTIIAVKRLLTPQNQ